MTKSPNPTYRLATADDMDAIFAVRTAVRENHIGIERLAALSITPESITHSFVNTSRGWVAEVDHRVVAFTIADRSTGSIFALFVQPGFDRHGLGAELLRLAGNWLMTQGQGPIWLTTGADTYAAEFYRRRGWQHTRTEADGQLRFEWAGTGLVDGPMIEPSRLDLIPLRDLAHDKAYHRIRRVELFERYEGPDVVYDPGVSGEAKPENLAHVLLLDGSVIGTIRVDLIDRTHAGLRLVAIDGEHKNRGYGAWMIAQAEAIVRAYDRREIVVNASKPARAFHERHGYRAGDWYDLTPIEPIMHVRLGKAIG